MSSEALRKIADMIENKVAAIFSGLPRNVIKQLVQNNIGEDSPVEKVNKVSPADLKKGVAYFGKSGGSTILVLSGKDGLGYWMTGDRNWTNYDSDNYKKFRSPKQMLEEAQSRLKEKGMSVKNWESAQPIRMNKQFVRDKEQKELDKVTPGISKSTLKHWMTKVIDGKKNKIIGKYDAYLNSYFERISKAINDGADSQVFYSISEETIRKMRNSLSSLDSFSEYLRGVFETRLWREDTSDKEILLKDVKYIKKQLDKAMSMEW